MSSLRWLVKKHDSLISMHRYEGEAVKAAIYLNDADQTDEYYVEKFDKRKAKWLDVQISSPADGA